MSDGLVVRGDWYDWSDRMKGHMVIYKDRQDTAQIA